jgi:plasmid maintenance system killer protein
MPVSKEELRQIPHLNVEALGDRTVNLMSLWDGEQWHSWVRWARK